MKTYKFGLEVDFNRELTDEELLEVEDKLWEIIAIADGDCKIVENTKELNVIHHVLYKMEE